MVGMIPIKDLRKGPIRTAQSRERVSAPMMKFFMCVAFSIAVTALTSAPTSAEAETIAAAPKWMGHTAGQSNKKHLRHRSDGNSYYSHHETYNGNWGFTPGNGLSPTDWGWRRSRGFWDTTAPACPFRTC